MIAVPKPARIQAEPLKQPGMDMDWLSSFTSDMPDPKIGAVKFLWPLKGRVIANFGSTSSGERNDGIDISAARGAPIHAAADGTVSYVGDELKAYGNLILIRHANGFITAYAHSDSVVVMRGQAVKRGQVIAFAGTTGDVNEPQLHFELRAGSKAIDPQPYLVASN
jgi:murein DD-endopeptidase MepM/ murein hydrolase activator NlpD